jgi:hypothetical protein
MQIQLSVPDCLGWFYSKKNNYALITGDGLLRKTNINEGVEVKGVLLVLDKLVRLNLIGPQFAEEKLELLL